MTKAKRITRKRSDARVVDRSSGERARSGKPWTSVLRRALTGRSGEEHGAWRERRGVWKPVRSFVSTALYKVYGELAGLSETRPALGRSLLARALTALGVKAPRVTASVTIDRPSAEVLGELRGFEEVRRFLSHVEQVEIVKDQDSAHFTFGDGPRRARTGVLSFTSGPGGRSTEIKAVLPGTQSAGWLARAVAGVLAETPRQRLFGDLRRVRQWLEAGEISTVVGQPSGRKAA
jgi:uncharacterized membrane protein